MANIENCIRLRLRFHRALGTVLATHKQAAATAKSSSTFMLVYRYIFRVVSKSKPKKSKLNKEQDRVETKELVFFVNNACVPAQLRICCSKLPCFVGCTQITLKSQLVYTYFEVATSARQKLH